jgi:hypothetical protein
MCGACIRIVIIGNYDRHGWKPPVDTNKDKQVDVSRG